MVTLDAMKPLVAFLCFCLCAACGGVKVAASESWDFDDYGGWRKLQGVKTGFFHTQKIAGRWWLVSPEGNVFFSKGVNSVHPPQAKGFAAGGAAKAAGFLHDWGMNTAGCWSDPDLTKEHVAVAIRARITGAHDKEFPDVFDPRWTAELEAAAAAICGPLRGDPWILGYFTDNELPWKHEDQAADFVQQFLQLPRTAPGYLAAAAAQRAGAAGMQAFREKAAELYFKKTADAVRKADPNHLILGCRFAGTPPIGVVRKMKGHADVISINNYMELPPLKLLGEMARAADLPVMVTEFSFKAPGGDLETRGSGPEKPTQAERARGYEAYVQTLARQDYCVGCHWFKYGETWQAAVQADGTPFPELTQAFARFNRSAEALHLR
jgi:hypothetical protein